MATLEYVPTMTPRAALQMLTAMPLLVRKIYIEVFNARTIDRGTLAARLGYRRLAPPHYNAINMLKNCGFLQEDEDHKYSVPSAAFAATNRLARRARGLP